MLVILSPARNVRPCGTQPPPQTKPQFLPEAVQLVEYIAKYSPWQLESVLEVSPKRAFDLYDAYRRFSPDKTGMPALLAYSGAAYRAMQPGMFSAEALQFAQRHLRIFSALYGLLRPMDGILTYRLNMSKRFCPGGQALYDFWQDKVYHALFEPGRWVVNLASQEYAKLVIPFMGPRDKMITCKFVKVGFGSCPSTVATVRAARGLMSKFIVQNQVTTPKELRHFDMEGYEFLPGLSNAQEYVFGQKSGNWGQRHG